MPEKQNIEWKTKWKDGYLEWICGFANAQGGKIYIGVNDEGEIVGLNNTRKLLEDIPNKIRNAMSIVVDVNLLEKDGHEYIEIVIPSYPVAISCKGVYYYRSGSTMQVLLNKHVSKPYNPSIAHIFYLAGFIENGGRGIEKICCACKEDGVPQPEYIVHPGDIMIKFTALEECIVRSTTHKVVDKVVDKVADKLNAMESKILNLLDEDPAYSYAILAEKAGISKKTVFLQIRSLKEKGIIERMGSDRKGYWKIKEKVW